MNRYNKLFKHLKSQHEGAFIPFVIIGDPDLATSFKIIECLIESGADALELGIPFSDPLADGPTIQNANLRAFAHDITPDKCFELLAKLRQKYPETPIGLLMYANLVFSNGIDNFYAKCQQTGVDSVLIADVPLEESQPFVESAQKHGILSVFICPPDANEALIQTLASNSQGYTYLLSRAGVTGTDNKQTTQTHADIITLLQKYHAAPPVQGFGISTPEQLKAALASGAAGAISGSAVVEIIERNVQDVPAMLQQLAKFVQTMKAATKVTSS
ncbi:MAG: tryptophan synthase subunit alpha [Saezia sp.]